MAHLQTLETIYDKKHIGRHTGDAAMTPENMTLDELLVEAALSKDPVAHEIARRMKSSQYGGVCNPLSSKGRTVLDVVERDESIIVKFTDGCYLVIDAEIDIDTVCFSIGRELIKSERFDLRLLSEPEFSQYLAEESARQEQVKAHEIETLKKKLAELEERP